MYCISIICLFTKLHYYNYTIHDLFITPYRVSKHTINTSPIHTLPGDLTLSDRSSSLPKFNVNSV